MSRQLLSIVIPVFNEGDSIRQVVELVPKAISSLSDRLDYELVFVDDSSNDNSFEILQDLASSNQRVKVIKLMGNVGAHMAIIAGLELCNGDMAVFLACDLQDPPEVIPKLVDALVEPFEIVVAIRQNRADTFFDKMFSCIFFWLLRKLVSDRIPAAGSSMYLLGEKALVGIRSFQEKNMTLESLLIMLDLRATTVPYERKARESGSSKWTLAKKLKIFADMFVAYSYAPLRLMSYTGILTALLGFAYAALIVSRRLLFSTVPEGWSSLMVVVLISGGAQMLMLGVIGEYLWRTLDQTRNRPRFRIEQKINFS